MEEVEKKRVSRRVAKRRAMKLWKMVRASSRYYQPVGAVYVDALPKSRYEELIESLDIMIRQGYARGATYWETINLPGYRDLHAELSKVISKMHREAYESDDSLFPAFGSAQWKLQQNLPERIHSDPVLEEMNRMSVAYEEAQILLQMTRYYGY